MYIYDSPTLVIEFAAAAKRLPLPLTRDSSVRPDAAHSIVLLGVLLLGRFRQLSLPESVHFRGIDAREDEVEDVAVPVDGFAFDAFFDVLERNKMLVRE
jgi:hypothetical protein